jgi:signal transduction histidine kinase
MNDEFKSKKQLIEELKSARLYVEELNKDVNKISAQLIDEIEDRNVLSKKLIKLIEKNIAEVTSLLHDQVGLPLAAAKLDLELYLNEGDHSSRVNFYLNGALAKIDTALVNIRNISKRLRPTTLERLGLISSLRELLNQITEKSSYQISFNYDDVPKNLPLDISLVIYRIVQESLFNITKYAEAKLIYVDVFLIDGHIAISVEDDGIGFDMAELRKKIPGEETLGLSLMQERVYLNGGELHIDSRPGHGTLIHAYLPLDSGEAKAPEDRIIEQKYPDSR